MISIVNLFGQEKTFLHTNTKISDSFHLFPMLRVDNELRKPKRVNKPLSVFHDIIEYKVKKNEQLNPH